MTFMCLKRALNLTRAPASLQTRASQFRWSSAFLQTPCVECNSVAPKPTKWLMARSAMLLRQGQRKSEPLQQEHPEQMERDCELRSCGFMRQSRSCVASGVRAEVSLASGSAARQHGRPPELRVKDGGSPILPTVRALAWITRFLLWWLLAILQCRPTWAPPEPLPVQECRGRLQIPPNTHAKVPPVPSSGPPGLPPLVFADQSSGWRPPTTPSRQLARVSQRNEDPTRPDTWGEKTTASLLVLRQWELR